MRKRKREQYLAGELMDSDISLDASGLEGDTSSREDPSSMPSLTGDLTTRLLSALMEENIGFPPPYTTTAPYLPGAHESGMGESGIPSTSLANTEWSMEGSGDSGSANGFGGLGYSEVDDITGEEKPKKGIKFLKVPAAKGPKGKLQVGKVKTEGLKPLSSSGVHGAPGSTATANTTTPVPLSASSAAITAKRTPWGTITDVAAIPARQVQMFTS